MGLVSQGRCGRPLGAAKWTVAGGGGEDGDRPKAELPSALRNTGPARTLGQNRPSLLHFDDCSTLLANMRLISLCALNT